jgi:hypothetical protein
VVATESGSDANERSRPSESYSSRMTMLIAYNRAGRPERLPPFGSFADWDLVRGALVWIGEPDPADTRSQVLAGDPNRRDLDEVLTLWFDALGREEILVGEIHRRAESASNAQGADAIRRLRDKLIEVTQCRSGWNAKRIGRWLGKIADRPVRGRRIVKARSTPTANGELWMIEEIQ